MRFLISVLLTLSSHLVNEFGFPEEHRISLVFVCFFLKSEKCRLMTKFNMSVKLEMESMFRRRF